MIRHILYVTLLSTICPCISFAQIQAPAPEFETVSVRPSDRQIPGEEFIPSLQAKPGSNLRLTNVSLRSLVELAYGVSSRQIFGPDWLAHPRFDIAAKQPPNTGSGQVRQMLQAVLLNRFRLVAHYEQDIMRILALEPGDSGLNLKSSPTAAGEAGCKRSFDYRNGHSISLECRALSAVEIAEQVQVFGANSFAGRPIIDMTGIKGRYDFKLEWSGDRSETGGTPPIYTALEHQLGLRLTARKRLVDILVIEHIEPTPVE
jgi:uncharacterized protein (TIGR03435 family)